MGYFYLIENIVDKLSVVVLFVDELLFYVLWLMCWDSDYVILFNDDILVMG